MANAVGAKDGFCTSAAGASLIAAQPRADARAAAAGWRPPVIIGITLTGGVAIGRSLERSCNGGSASARCILSATGRGDDTVDPGMSGFAACSIDETDINGSASCGNGCRFTPVAVPVAGIGVSVVCAISATVIDLSTGVAASGAVGIAR